MRPAERAVAFYNQRGKAEPHIKEGKNAIKWTQLSCHNLGDNAVRLQLHALAYNLANHMRTLTLPREAEHWPLTTLREKLVKIGAKVVSHGRYVAFHLAEEAMPRELFRKFSGSSMGCGRPLCRHDDGPSSSILATRRVRYVRRKSKCALTAGNGHGAGFLIAKSARSRADR
jgi:hypothetical protein